VGGRERRVAVERAPCAAARTGPRSFAFAGRHAGARARAGSAEREVPVAKGTREAVIEAVALQLAQATSPHAHSRAASHASVCSALKPLRPMRAAHQRGEQLELERRRQRIY